LKSPRGQQKLDETPAETPPSRRIQRFSPVRLGFPLTSKTVALIAGAVVGLALAIALFSSLRKGTSEEASTGS
jgi:hypothetical protein